VEVQRRQALHGVSCYMGPVTTLTVYAEHLQFIQRTDPLSGHGWFVAFAHRYFIDARVDVFGIEELGYSERVHHIAWQGGGQAGVEMSGGVRVQLKLSLSFDGCGDGSCQVVVDKACPSRWHLSREQAIAGLVSQERKSMAL
jgi:hypothetical protein